MSRGMLQQSLPASQLMSLSLWERGARRENAQHFSNGRGEGFGRELDTHSLPSPQPLSQRERGFIARDLTIAPAHNPHHPTP